MEMPALLPSHLNVYSSFNEESLFEELVKSPRDLMEFFIYAADDETWSDEHPKVMEQILHHFTGLVLEKKLQFSETQALQRKIQEHIKILNPYLPLNLIFEIDSNEISENSLLFMAASPVLHDLIYHEHKERKSSHIGLRDVPLEIFNVIEEFVKTGEIAALWKFNEQELKNIYAVSKKLKLKISGELCEIVLKRYLTRENVISTLIDAHVEEQTILRQACFDFIDELDTGVHFHQSDISYLVCEFLSFKTNAMTIFDQVKHLITHLIFKKDLDSTSEFSFTVNQCPRLIHLDLSQSLSFSRRIFDVPNHLAELNISSCHWLKASSLVSIFDHFKELKTLILSDNIELDYNSYTVLSKLKQLKSLDISKNPQIQDDDFKLILQACQSLIDLDCSECKNIGDAGFFEVARSATRLRFLNFERCQISDGILVEIAIRLPYLEKVNLTHCSLLTDRGILDFVKQANALKSITVKYCNILDSTITEIKKQRPYIEIFT